MAGAWGRSLTPHAPRNTIQSSATPNHQPTAIGLPINLFDNAWRVYLTSNNDWAQKIWKQLPEEWKQYYTVATPQHLSNQVALHKWMEKCAHSKRYEAPVLSEHGYPFTRPRTRQLGLDLLEDIKDDIRDPDLKLRQDIQVKLLGCLAKLPQSTTPTKSDMKKIHTQLDRLLFPVQRRAWLMDCKKVPQPSYIKGVLDSI